MSHTMQVTKTFMIKDREGNFIRIPKNYILKGVARCYADDLVEYCDLHCDADDKLIAEETIINKLPCEYAKFTD